MIISAGFDAAEGDPLGGMRLTPRGYHHMASRLMALPASRGRIVALLEGGYNLEATAGAAEATLRAMLRLPPPPPPPVSARQQGMATRGSPLRSVIGSGGGGGGGGGAQTPTSPASSSSSASASASSSAAVDLLQLPRRSSEGVLREVVAAHAPFWRCCAAAKASGTVYKYFDQIRGGGGDGAGPTQPATPPPPPRAPPQGAPPGV